MAVEMSPGEEVLVEQRAGPASTRRRINMADYHCEVQMKPDTGRC